MAILLDASKSVPLYRLLRTPQQKMMMILVDECEVFLLFFFFLAWDIAIAFFSFFFFSFFIEDRLVLEYRIN